MDRSSLKQSLRKELIAKRNTMSPEEVTKLSNQIFERWCNRFSIRKVSYLHVFQSIVDSNEVQTQPYMDYIRRKHPQVRVVVPVVDKAAGDLKHAYIEDDIQLIPNRWGIPEPKMPVTMIYPLEIDMVLVPMLAFDAEGNRLGYGAGYYDKFLELTRPNCIKIGLCFEMGRQAELLPSEAHDVKLDFVVTESTIERFNPNFQL